MTESKPLLKKENRSVVPRQCPICGVQTNYTYRIEESNGNQSTWYKCQNGVIFQDEVPEQSTDNIEQVASYGGGGWSKLDVSFQRNKKKAYHAARTYCSIIEELTFGRTMLDVGFSAKHNMKFFEDRGWLVWGVDINQAVETDKNIFVGDFETADFDIKGEGLKESIGVDRVNRTFDLIWMSHVFEHFKDPLEALKKAYTLLEGNGVLYISTPDIEFIHKTGISGFPHWKKDEHNIMWSERALVRELEKVGFKVILKRRNYSSRFISWHDLHIICQKAYF